MEIAIVGDTIEWSFGNDYPNYLANKTFQSKVVIIDNRDKVYGVYADYGQDLIPFDTATIIKKQ